MQATSVANVRGLPATEEEDEDEDDEEKMQVALPAPSVGDLKSFLSSEIKDIVKAQVRSEMKALKSTMTSELKELKKLYKAREKETERYLVPEIIASSFIIAYANSSQEITHDRLHSAPRLLLHLMVLLKCPFCVVSSG